MKKRVKEERKMNRSKKLLTGMIALLVLFVLLLASTITLWYLEIVKQPLYVSLELAGIAIIIGFAAFLFALYVNEQRTIREGIKENEYNLHRKVVFYSYNYFSRALSSTLKRHKRRSGYLIVFNAVKTNAITTYTINKTADFNGYIADFILDKHILGKEYGDFNFCFYRGNFLFYLMCDDSKLNNFITDMENEAYRLVREMDFRINVQPTFGIYEHEGGKEESIYEMTNKAIAAREVAEKNYENALFFSEEMIQDTTSNEADEIAKALDNNEFVVYYQPKFNLNGREFNSSEALIRWNSPTRGLLSPMRFINSAENGGLIHRIDMFVFEQVCKDLDETKRKGRRQIPVSINFSLYEFYHPTFVKDIAAIIEKYNTNPNLLEIEIVEGTTAANIFLSISILKKLKEIGLKILMDDFGVGFSNFNNLKNLPIDVIKIDKSFIDNITTDIKSREITRFMIEFAKEIGLEVVAEGVDNQKQVDLLKKFKCDTIQGFFYSKPLPRNEFERFLATNTFEKRRDAR